MWDNSSAAAVVSLVTQSVPRDHQRPAHLAADAFLLCLELIDFLLRSVMVTLNLAQRTVCRAAAWPAVIAVQQSECAEP